MNRRDIASWLATDPRIRKWLVQCVACQAVGYRAQMPEDAFDARRIMRQFRAIDLDEYGRCADCRRRQGNGKPSENEDAT